MKLDEKKITITLAVLGKLVEFAVNHGPKAISEVKRIMEIWKDKREVTEEDWDKLMSKWDKDPEEYFK